MGASATTRSHSGASTLIHSSTFDNSSVCIGGLFEPGRPDAQCKCSSASAQTRAMRTRHASAGRSVPCATDHAGDDCLKCDDGARQGLDQVGFTVITLAGPSLPCFTSTSKPAAGTHARRLIPSNVTDMPVPDGHGEDYHLVLPGCAELWALDGLSRLFVRLPAPHQVDRLRLPA